MTLVPKSPVTGFAAGENQGPYRSLFNELHNVLVGRWPKVRAKRLNHCQRALGGFFQIGFQRQGDKPPWVVVKGAIVVALVELVHAQRKAKPKNPAFEIRLSTVVDQVVGPTERK